MGSDFECFARFIQERDDNRVSYLRYLPAISNARFVIWCEGEWWRCIRAAKLSGQCKTSKNDERPKVIHDIPCCHVAKYTLY